ncbi:FeoB-associated Cys-rich membrane protein [Cohnella luojiensis]|uniref:LPXTG cell wall anchor domain-containing protein n=1 Tax=Cohnella luojiensis TaxID=652876 RepID=A0A4Y8LWN0_9BACL|nr:FeoB-associated Cys-rich membrane protein [Cohnella luojiensis]TFE25015.1 hypothetical protein E2980_14765 [Cohnella luojiensis]
MKRLLQFGLAIIFAAMLFAPSQVSAYSYGDANTEEVAETFKLVETALNGPAPDWNAAEEAYKVRKSEIKSHFGDAVASILDHNFQAKDVNLTLSNFKAVLVLNLDRRFNYALADLNDYAQAKLLLAKAKSTYATLQPHMELDAGEIDKAFEDALTALGNPGLFGVGKKEPDPEAFKSNVSFIQNKISLLFPLQGAEGEEASPSLPVDEPVQHAPLERTQKTNVGVTIVVIAAMAAIGGFIIWWMRRKK